jgi:hypothetical protein
LEFVAEETITQLQLQHQLQDCSRGNRQVADLFFTAENLQKILTKGEVDFVEISQIIGTSG